MKNYKEKYKKIEELPKKINQIYIIPSKIYNGFWGKNGFRSFGFIIGYNDEIYGWFHWEGDVIDLNNNYLYGMRIDSSVENKFIRLYTDYNFKFTGLNISECSIEVEK